MHPNMRYQSPLAGSNEMLLDGASCTTGGATELCGFPGGICAAIDEEIQVVDFNRETVG